MAEEQTIPQDRRAPAVPYPVQSQSDHDAIVTLVAETRALGRQISDMKNVELKDIKADIKEVKENVADRVRDLEQEKMDKAEAVKLQADAKIIHDDHENRIRSNETFINNFKGKYAILAVFGSLFISIAVSLIMLAVNKLIN